MRKDGFSNHDNDILAIGYWTRKMQYRTLYFVQRNTYVLIFFNLHLKKSHNYEYNYN